MDSQANLDGHASSLEQEARHPVDFSKSRAAKNLDRLAADAELHHCIMIAGYTGPAWDRFASALAEYGYQVLLSWIKSGAVAQRCREKGTHGAPESIPETAKLACHDLATDTVVAALPKFRDEILRKQVWDPAKGASLKTFFIGKCLHHFPDIYRAWSRCERRLNLAKRAATAEDHRSSSIEKQIAARQEIVRSLSNKTHLDEEILSYWALGYTDKEIGELLSMNRPAVSSRRHRLQASARARSNDA